MHGVNLNRFLFTINLWIAVQINWQLYMGPSVWSETRVIFFIKELFKKCVYDSKCSSRKMIHFRPQISLSSYGKNRCFNRVFGAFTQIMEQQTTFSTIFNVLRWIAIVITSKFRNKFSVKNFKKARDTPGFFSIFRPKIYFWIYYGLNLSGDP